MPNEKLVRNRFYWYLSIIVTAVTGLGVAITLNILSATLFSSPNLIQTTYTTIVQTQNSHQVKVVLQNLQLPWQNPVTSTTGFGNFAISPAAQAFAAGLWSGQQTLLGNDNPTLPPSLSPPLKELSWSQTGWKRDFELGQWILLLWTVTQVSPPLSKAFWEQQQQILLYFQAEFSTSNQSSPLETQRVTSALEFIKPLIKATPVPAQHEPHLYKQLGRELAFIIDNLSP